MCGISGIANQGDERVLEAMNLIQTHRGPDDGGVWVSRTQSGDLVGLAARRLAILDLSLSGHMPMTTEDGRYTIVYNGEIYNYPTLRRELEASGHYLRSHSDTEAILLLYQEYGPASLGRLNGMFAIAIWDAHRQELFLARDHFGIKPLYYCHQGARLAFASEAKALLLLPGVPRRMNWAALRQYLTFLWVPEPLTMFEGIDKLPAGHYARFRDGVLDLVEYWDLPLPPADARFPEDETSLAAELRERFTAGVRAHLLSDVPLGAFLSAGLDSSGIVAAMATASAEPVRTFTIDFPPEYRRGEIVDDAAVARRTARHFGCRHTEIVVRPDVADLLPKLVWHMDDPTADPAIIAAYLVCREATPSATVMLSGVGGDELFAGYRKYQAHGLAERYRRLPAVARRDVIEPLIDWVPSFRGTPVKGYVRLAKKMARSGSLPPQERFLTDSVYLSAAEQDDLVTPSTIARLNGDDPLAPHRGRFARVAHADFLNQMLYLDAKTFLVGLNLNYNDKMSMASSVEVRVPFLDWQLAEWVMANVPPRLKLRGRQTKAIFRQAMAPLLPPEVLRQKKAGFGVPIDYWLADDLRGLVDDLLSPAVVARRGIFRLDTVRRYVDEQRSGRRDRSYQIWALLTLELWLRAFID